MQLPSIAAVLALAASTASAAEPVFKFGTPTFFGSGCPAGSVEIVPSTDMQSVSVLFSAYRAETTPTLARDRKSCNLAVPVDVKPGVSIGIFKVDYRGNVFVPNQVKNQAKFDVEYYFAGMRGPLVNEVFPAGTNKDIYITNDIAVGAIVWSPCGASTNFRINSAITAEKPQATTGDQVQIAVDSVDTVVKNSFRYYITTKQC